MKGVYFKNVKSSIYFSTVDQNTGLFCNLGNIGLIVKKDWSNCSFASFIFAQLQGLGVFKTDISVDTSSKVFQR